MLQYNPNKANSGQQLPTAQAVPVAQLRADTSASQGAYPGAQPQPIYGTTSIPVQQPQVQYAQQQGPGISFQEQQATQAQAAQQHQYQAHQQQQQQQYGGLGGGMGGNRIEDMDIMIRHGFIRKVFSILSVQLLVTFGMVFAISFSQDAQDYIAQNSWLFYLAFFMSIVCVCCIICSEKAARSFPTNYILLGTFTVCEGFLVGIVAATYAVETVAAAVGVTALISISLMLFACQTKYDFTGMGPYLLVALVALIFLGFLKWWFPALQVVYAGLGVLIFSFYIVYDTQLVVGGKHAKYQFSIDDYVFAALSLYLDIINLFLLILQLFGRDD